MIRPYVKPRGLNEYLYCEELCTRLYTLQNQFNCYVVLVWFDSLLTCSREVHKATFKIAFYEPGGFRPVSDFLKDLICM